MSTELIRGHRYLITRLRTRPTGDPYLHMLVHEAADELERLRALVDKLQELMPEDTTAQHMAAEEARALLISASPTAGNVATAQQDTTAPAGRTRPAETGGAQSRAVVPSLTVEGREAAAKAIYALFDGAADHHWVEGGNSFKQDDARRYARAALEAQPAAQAEPVAWAVYWWNIDGRRQSSVHFERGTAEAVASTITVKHEVVPLYPAPPSNQPAQGAGPVLRELLDALDVADEGCTSGGLGPGWQNGLGIECGTRIAAARQAARAALAQAPAAAPLGAAIAPEHDEALAQHAADAEKWFARDMQDAARYRFLRDADRSDPAIDFETLLSLAMESMDAAIDAAMAAAKEQP